ncbi:RNA-dependent RNA polymerase [Dirofilaria immitis]
MFRYERLAKDQKIIILNIDTKNKRNAKTKWTRNWTIVINPKIICELKNLCREQFIAIIQLSSVRLSSQENNCQKMNERITICEKFVYLSEIIMNGNCNKELMLLILLVLFVPTTYSTMIPFLSTLRCSQDWENGQLPSFVPKSKQARREFCDIHERIELSRNQLEHMLEQWAVKYNIWEKFMVNSYQDTRQEEVYRGIFKNKIENYISGIRHIFLEIFDLLGDKSTAMETINKKINEILDGLPAKKWIYILDVWATLDEEATKEAIVFMQKENWEDAKKNERNLFMMLNPLFK